MSDQVVSELCQIVVIKAISNVRAMRAELLHCRGDLQASCSSILPPIIGLRTCGMGMKFVGTFLTRRSHIATRAKPIV